MSKPIPFKHYGYSIHRLVTYIAQMPDKSARQQCAEKLVEIMRDFQGKRSNKPENMKKVWQDLFAIAGYKLDVEAPFDLPPTPAKQLAGARLPYPSPPPRLRQYGHYVPQLLRVIDQLPADKQDTALDQMLALWGSGYRKELSQRQILQDFIGIAPAGLQEKIKKKGASLLPTNATNQQVAVQKKEKSERRTEPAVA